MKLLIVLTYYRPHTSGLTIYAERLAKAMVRRGHQVTVLTSHFQKDLPYDEVQDGVRIIRVPVAFRLSKGVIMPTFGWVASRLAVKHDAIQLHLPQFDAAGLALRGRLLKKPTIVTYHCDLLMPPGIISWMANQAVTFMNNLTAIWSHRIVTYTQDYAENSNYARRYLKKVEVIDPPVELPDVSEQEIRDYRNRNILSKSTPVIGMAARFATEKGVEVLLAALPKILDAYPNALVQFAGPYQNIIGEEEYFSRLWPLIQKYQEHNQWQFLGMLGPHKMALFYHNIDLLVLPSLNSTEAFGLVQIEAMLNGVPCIASNLPGVRQPVMRHSMGKVVPIGDSNALAEAAIDILKHRKQYQVDQEALKKQYSPDSLAEKYEILFKKIAEELK
ncbi:MAG TPA: glycosyltransferase family 4 protein [Longilinea sp.]|nr:glycosyltransferase family 4 protein [Longilinea sp.]